MAPLIDVYKKEWEKLRRIGVRTIEIIDEAKAWEFRVAPQEFTILQTFHHTIKAIFEDAGNWFLGSSDAYIPSNNPKSNLNRAMDRMATAIAGIDDSSLGEPFGFQWGEESTVEGAIQQELFHAIAHFGQLRERAGVCRRMKEKQLT